MDEFGSFRRNGSSMCLVKLSLMCGGRTLSLVCGGGTLWCVSVVSGCLSLFGFVDSFASLSDVMLWASSMRLLMPVDQFVAFGRR